MILTHAWDSGLVCDSCKERVDMCSNCNSEFKHNSRIYCDYEDTEHYCEYCAIRLMSKEAKK